MIGRDDQRCGATLAQADNDAERHGATMAPFPEIEQQLTNEALTPTGAWSSYAGYHWARRCVPWVTYGRVLGEFGREPVVARQRYRRFVAAGLDQPLDSPLDEAVHGVVLGSERFVSRVRRLLDRRADDRGVPALRRLRSRPSMKRITRSVSARFGMDASAWVPGRREDSLGRAAAAYLARCRFGYSATAVADALGYAGPSSVSQAIRRIAATSSRLAKALREIEQQLTND